MHKHLLHDSLIHIRSKKKWNSRDFSGIQSGFITTFQDVENSNKIVEMIPLCSQKP